MADLDFKLVIDATFEKLDGIQKSLDDLAANAEKAGKSIEKQGNKLDQFGKKMESVGKKLSLALTLPITAFAATSIKAFAEQEKNIAKFTDSFEKQGARIGFTFDELKSQAEGFADNTLFEDDDILGGVTSQLLNFQIATKEIFTEAQATILDFSAKTGQDLNSATLAIGKALQNPTEGLNLLRRSGLAVTDSQIAMIAKLDKAGKSAEAQAAIIKLLKDQYEGFAEQLANTDTGKLQLLQKTFKQLQENFGQAFLKVFRPLIEFLTDLIKKIDQLNPNSKVLLAIFASIVAGIGPLVFAIGTVTTALATLGIPLLAIAGPVGLLALLGVGLIAVSQHFGSLEQAANKLFLSLNEGLLKIFPNSETLKKRNADLRAAIAQAEFDLKNNGLIGPPEPPPPINTELSPADMKAIEDLAKKRADFLVEADKEIMDAAEARMKENAPRFLGTESGTFAFNIPGQPEQVALMDRSREKFSEIKDEIEELNTAEAVMANSFSNFFEDMAFGAKSAADAVKELGRSLAQSLFSTALRSALQSGFAGLFGGGNAQGGPIGENAAGGHIKGPGTGTSDSILSRLSNGEFVVRAASVRKFGVDFFNALNAGIMPKLKMGGHVKAIRNSLSGVPRFAEGGMVSQQGNIFVNVENKSSGPPVSAQVDRKIDAQGSIINIVLTDLRNNGPISQQLQGAFNVRR